MKKLLLSLSTILLSAFTFGQINIVQNAPPNITTTGLRGPNGTLARSFLRVSSIVQTSELSLIPSGTSIDTFGFVSNSGANVQVAGNITVYMINSTDANFSRGTDWATIIAGMTQVYSGAYTVPNTATNIDLTLTTPFVYTGGSVYVAFDFNRTGTAATTGAGYGANSALVGGCVSQVNQTAAPTTLVANDFRPSIRFGFVNPNSNDMSIEAISSLGNVATAIGLPTPISAVVTNKSNTTLTNVVVSAGVSGSNSYSNSQTIPTLAAGAATTVNFADWTPTALGTNVINVSVPADQVNSNNSINFNSTTTCFTSGTGQSGVSYAGGVGFNTGTGIISTPILNSVATTIVGVNLAISSDAASVGKTVFGVLLDNAGVILAQSPNTVLAAGDSNTIKAFTFPTAIAVAANQQVHVGLGQVVNAVGFFPIGAYTNPNLTTLYNTCAITGGPLTALAVNLGQLGIEVVFSGTCTLSTNSINNIDNKISFYPNPVENILSIDSENININSITITDLNGRVIKNNIFDNVSDIKINLSDLSSGIYMMNINSSEGSVIKKIMKN